MRNPIPRYDRLMVVKDRLELQIRELALIQLPIMIEIIKELELHDDSCYRDLLRYDYIKINGEGGTIVELWQTGYRYDPDEYLTEVLIDPLIIAGDTEAYRTKFRTSLKKRADDAAAAKRKTRKDKREQLRDQLTQITSQLAKLDDEFDNDS